MASFETFREIGPYEAGSLTQGEPSCDNGCLRIRKYKVTVELVDEPISIIQDRIRELWAKKSHHHVSMLIKAAKKYNLVLETR